MKICDLHTHSIYSDGTFTPEELIIESKKKGLSAIALTDHNNICGVEIFKSFAEKNGIEGIAGVEFSTDYGQKELHILGLFLKKEYYNEVTKRTESLLKRKDESNRILVERLRLAGYDVDYDKIKESVKGTVNRAHIGEVLYKKGYVKSIADALKSLLSKDGLYYHTPKRLDVFETIEFIRSIGSTPVLAHPFLDLDAERLFLAKAVKFGLVGMETVYSTYDDGTTLLAKKIAKEFNLKDSGGSDFHGERKPGISLATGKGNLIIPYEFCKNLRP